MLKLLAPLFGFAVFGALFAGLYYIPDEVERSIGTPKFRLDPGEVKPDFIEPAALGENITVNITVLRGGPIDVFLMDMENLTVHVLNGTQRSFDIANAEPFYNRTYSAVNVTQHHNFTFVADGENRWAVVVVSKVPPHPDPENQTAAERDLYLTEVDVDMRYLDSERKSLVLGYILAAPSVGLVIITFWIRYKRVQRGKHPETHQGTSMGERAHPETPRAAVTDPRDL